MTLAVDVTAGDWTIGFMGFAWHTHGDILDAWGYEGTPEARTRAFVDDVLQSHRVIAVVRIDGKVSDLFVLHDVVERPLSTYFDEYAAPDETMEFRYWNGHAAE